jgi:hypothetical protein
LISSPTSPSVLGRIGGRLLFFFLLISAPLAPVEGASARFDWSLSRGKVRGSDCGDGLLLWRRSVAGCFGIVLVVPEVRLGT